jgi:hypothetical protein
MEMLKCASFFRNMSAPNTCNCQLDCWPRTEAYPRRLAVYLVSSASLLLLTCTMSYEDELCIDDFQQYVHVMQFLAKPANSTSKLAAYAAIAWEVAHQRLVKTGLLGLGQECCRTMNTYAAASYNVAADTSC